MDMKASDPDPIFYCLSWAPGLRNFADLIHWHLIDHGWFT